MVLSTSSPVNLAQRNFNQVCLFGKSNSDLVRTIQFGLFVYPLLVFCAPAAPLYL